MANYLLLAFLPEEMNNRRPSYGTTIEIGWAIGLRKPLIVVSDDKYLMDHPLIKHNASWRFDNLEDAIEVIIGLFGDYVGPTTHKAYYDYALAGRSPNGRQEEEASLCK